MFRNTVTRVVLVPRTSEIRSTYNSDKLWQAAGGVQAECRRQADGGLMADARLVQFSVYQCSTLVLPS